MRRTGHAKLFLLLSLSIVLLIDSGCESVMTTAISSWSSPLARSRPSPSTPSVRWRKVSRKRIPNPLDFNTALVAGKDRAYLSLDKYLLR